MNWLRRRKARYGWSGIPSASAEPASAMLRFVGPVRFRARRWRGAYYTLTGIRLHAWFRLVAWVVFGAPVWFVRPWLTPVAIAVFELSVVVLSHPWRRARLEPGWSGDGFDPPSAGDREPRKPLPKGGAGSAAIAGPDADIV